MVDGGASGIKQVTEETAQAVGEIAKDVKDAVGEMIEQNVQTAVGPKLTPQQVQQKQQEDQKNLAETRRKIEFLKNIDQEQKRVREANRQKEAQRLQDQKQEKQVIEMKKEEKKKQPMNPAIAYAGKVEFKRGVGG